MGWPGRKYNSPEYRYGFNGQEKDDEGEFGSQTNLSFKYRIYNPAIGRFLSTDPLSEKFSYYTPYQFAGNSPVSSFDLEDKEGVWGAIVGGGAEWLAQGLVNSYQSGDFSPAGLKKSFINKVNFTQVAMSTVQGAISAQGTTSSLLKIAKVSSEIAIEIGKSAVVIDDATGKRKYEDASATELITHGLASYGFGEVASLGTKVIVKSGGTGAVKQAKEVLEKSQKKLDLNKRWAKSVKSGKGKSGRLQEVAKSQKETGKAFRKAIVAEAIAPISQTLKKAPIVTTAVENIVKAPAVQGVTTEVIDILEAGERPDSIEKINSDGTSRTFKWNKDTLKYEHTIKGVPNG